MFSLSSGSPIFTAFCTCFFSSSLLPCFHRQLKRRAGELPCQSTGIRSPLRTCCQLATKSARQFAEGCPPAVLRCARCALATLVGLMLSGLFLFFWFGYCCWIGCVIAFCFFCLSSLCLVFGHVVWWCFLFVFFSFCFVFAQAHIVRWLRLVWPYGM